MQSHLNSFLESVEKQGQYTQNTIAAYKNDLGQFYQFIVEVNASLCEEFLYFLILSLIFCLFINFDSSFHEQLQRATSPDKEFTQL